MENNVELKEKLKELNNTFDMLIILQDQTAGIFKKQIELWGELMALGMPMQMALEGMSGAAKSALIMKAASNMSVEVSKACREALTELEKGE